MVGTALQKITREAKRIRAKHKGKSWKSAVKEASRKYNSGTIGKKRSGGAKKKRRKSPRKNTSMKRRKGRGTAGTRRRKRTVKASRRRSAPRKVRTRTRYKAIHKVRRVSGTGGGVSTNTVVMLGGIALVAWLLTRKSSSSTVNTGVQGAPPLVLTTNQQRNNESQQIIAWATAGGMAVDAIIKLINSLNNKSDAEVSAIHSSIDSGSGVPDWAFIA